MSASALGKPYDDSRDQPLPGMPADNAARPAAVALPGSSLAERIAAAGKQQPATRIDLTNEAEAIRNVRRAILRRALPATYKRHGRLVVVDELEKPPARGFLSRGGSNLAVRDIEPPTLRRLVAEHTWGYKLKPESRKADAKLVEVEAAPPVQVCRDVLDAHQWPGVQPLAGVTSAPVLRPDGTLVQDPGYDEATGMFYAPALDVGRIPERPAAAVAAAAREFVLDTVLGDFPWVDKADKANYLALLVAPILRTMAGALVPLGAITAAAAGTGKTLLAGDIPAALYGITSRPWVADDEEVRKAVSTVLARSAKPVVLFDNVPEWQSVSSPMLAKLLTSAQWDDRVLGSNTEIDVENDRLWLVTGNSMTFGGDIPSRTVLVRVDAEMSRPDLRDPREFKIGNLQAWLVDPDNAAELLRQLLIMVADWVAAGRHDGDYVMRQFTPWARAAGGFLDHHGVHGFLANRSALDVADDETTAWLAFVAEWHSQFGTAWKSPTEIARSATQMFEPMSGSYDPWNGHYLVDGKGHPVTAVGLGKRLTGKIGKIFGGDVHGFRLERVVNTRTGQSSYRVIKAADIHNPDLDVLPAATEAAAALPAPRQVGLWGPGDQDD